MRWLALGVMASLFAGFWAIGFLFSPRWASIALAWLICVVVGAVVWRVGRSACGQGRTDGE